MKKRFQLPHLIFVFTLTVLSGCAMQSSKPAADSGIYSLAVLPAAVPANVVREKIMTIRSQLIEQLKATGFQVMDESVVTASCTENGCKDPEAFAKKYNVQGFVKLDIQGVSRTNLLAAFYNSIYGTVTVTDPQGKELFNIPHTESERGGLLFNSGQVFQGLISTAENTEQASFTRLAEKFAQAIALELPRPSIKEQSSPASSEIQIQSVSSEPKGDSRYKICAKGTPDAQAALVIDRLRGMLREEKRGEYCGIFPIGGVLQDDSRIAVELRSSYGTSVQKRLDQTAFASCLPEGLVTLTDGYLRLGCNDSQSDCEKKLKVCRNHKLLVYKASSEGGPFVKSGTLSSNGERADKEPVYAVLPIGKDGSAATPVTVSQGEK